MFFKHFASKNQQPDLSISRTLVENGSNLLNIRCTICQRFHFSEFSFPTSAMCTKFEIKKFRSMYLNVLLHVYIEILYWTHILFPWTYFWEHFFFVSCVSLRLGLNNFYVTLFFPIFSFDPPENITKFLVFWYFQGDPKGILGRKS